MTEHDPTTPLARGGISLRLYPHDDGPAAQLSELRQQAELGALAGYDGVQVSEHHAGFPGYLPNPVQLAGFLLPAMSRGWAAPCPLLLPLKPHALIVEELAWLAAAFPGRVGAGFAAGALPVDFELAEVPFDEVIARFKAALPPTVEALRGNAVGPLASDRAVAACQAEPIPMVVGAQSRGAVRRAAKHQIGVLYDSLQTNAHSRMLSDAYDEAGGRGPKLLIRRVWIGDIPRSLIEAQMAHYRSYAPDAAIANWGDGDSTIVGADGVEAAEALHACMQESNCDTINVRVHVVGLEPAMARQQLERHGSEFLPRLAQLMGRTD